MTVWCVVCAGLLSCARKQPDTASSSPGAETWNQSSAESEYRLVQMEMQLAQGELPYLVLDLKQGQLKLKLKGTVVWNYPMEFAGADSPEVRDFAERFNRHGATPARPLVGKHLFAAKDKTPDSVLAIVGEVVRVDPALLQREVPERFQLLWDDGLVLEIRTDVTGQPISKFQNAMVEVREALRRPFGGAVLVLKVDPEKALTLYRVTTRGTPTLVYPPGPAA